MIKYTKENQRKREINSVKILRLKMFNNMTFNYDIIMGICHLSSNIYVK